MGNWNGYHLTVGVGARDPETVAEELREALPRLASEVCDRLRDLTERDNDHPP